MLVGFISRLWQTDAVLVGFFPGLWQTDAGAVGFPEGVWQTDALLVGFIPGLWQTDAGAVGFPEGVWQTDAVLVGFPERVKACPKVFRVKSRAAARSVPKTDEAVEAEKSGSIHGELNGSVRRLPRNRHLTRQRMTIRGCDAIDSLTSSLSHSITPLLRQFPAHCQSGQVLGRVIDRLPSFPSPNAQKPEQTLQRVNGNRV